MSGNKLRTYAGAVAVVTGAASGIGRALAEALAQRGSEVVLADRQIEKAEEAASGIRADGGKAQAARLDVADFPAVARLIQDTAGRTGRLDYVFNNAGIVIGGTVDRLGIEDWKRMVDVNLLGVIHGIQAAYPVMVKQGFGHIVNTASAAGFFAGPGNAAYTATKSAVIALSISLRAEAAPLGIRVSVLCPGVVRTPILEGGQYGKMPPDIPRETLARLLERARPMAPARFAEKALAAVAGNRAVIVIPAWWKAPWWLQRLFPSLALFLTQKLFQYSWRKLAASKPDADGVRSVR